MHVRTTSALAYYHRREFAEAQHLLELVSQLDPYRLEHMDTYSNILFVHGDRARLSELAARAHATDKYRVQTCCIVGNYYAMRGDHSRAILYFKRALALEPSYLSAWTLMGHEHVELRATPQAIECYRRALDINPLDYRAWYGLGQTYEILQMHRYALYYFKRAAGIKPYDPRMWCAVGENYEKLAMDTAANAGSAAGPGAAAGGAGGSLQAARLLESALKCYQKAEGNHDADGLALHKLAKLHRRRGQTDLAAQYYMRVLRRHEGEGGALAAGVGTAEWAAQDGAASGDPAAAAAAAALDSSVSARPALPSSSSQLLPGGTAPPLHQDAIDAILFLAEYHKMHGRYPLAEAYATRLLDVGSVHFDFHFCFLKLSSGALASHRAGTKRGQARARCAVGCSSRLGRNSDALSFFLYFFF
jgi:anaphase-promoting complex subunit 8